MTVPGQTETSGRATGKSSFAAKNQHRQTGPAGPFVPQAVISQQVT